MCSEVFSHDFELSEEQLEEYKQNGFLVLEQVLSEEVLEKMREQAMAAWSEKKGPFDEKKTWLQNSLLPDIHRFAPIIREYYFNGPLVQVASQLIGPNIKGATSQLTFKLRGNTMPFGWHQDNGYGELDPYNSVSCLTALDDTSTENGCLWLVPRSHLRGQLTSLTLEKKRAGAELVVEVDESEAIPMAMKAGSVLLMHCHMLHKSGGNSSDKDRRILFLRYADADAVEVFNARAPRIGKLVRGNSKFHEVEAHEQDLDEQPAKRQRVQRQDGAVTCDPPKV